MFNKVFIVENKKRNMIAKKGFNTIISAEIIVFTERLKFEIIPELRVATDNSNASHGVPVHPVRETDIFYLMIRGLSQSKALHLLKNGFLEG